MTSAGDATRSGAEHAPSAPEAPTHPKTGLDDPHAVQILTAEHWSLLSTRTLGYQEMFARTTIFIAVLSAIGIALALLAQATHFSHATLILALLLLSIGLFIGLTTFIRSVAINYEDAHWVTGMNLLRQAYLRIIPEIEPFFVTGHRPGESDGSLAHGQPQRREHLLNSLTTTSSVVAALNSIIAGALAGGVAALFGWEIGQDALVGEVVSVASAVLHVRHAARFRAKPMAARQTP